MVFLYYRMVKPVSLPPIFTHFYAYYNKVIYALRRKLQNILCNRFNKPKVLNNRDVHLLSLRGPNVLILASLAYGDGSTHINVRNKN